MTHHDPVPAGRADEHPEARCQRCDGPNVWSWSAPSPLWNAVMRDRETGDDAFSIVCPPCFAELAALKGLGGPVIDGLPRWTWRFAPDIPGDEIAALRTHPDGLIWDWESWLWVEPESRAALAAGQAEEDTTALKRRIVELEGVIRKHYPTIAGTVMLHDKLGETNAADAWSAVARDFWTVTNSPSSTLLELAPGAYVSTRPTGEIRERIERDRARDEALRAAEEALNECVAGGHRPYCHIAVRGEGEGNYCSCEYDLAVPALARLRGAGR